VVQIADGQCARCGLRPAPPYHSWCTVCYAAWRRRQRGRRLAGNPARAAWERLWTTLKMRAYRGHEMREAPCTSCGAKGTLMLLRMAPARWTWLCPPCRQLRYPGRDRTGWPTTRPTRAEEKILQAIESVGL